MIVPLHFSWSDDALKHHFLFGHVDRLYKTNLEDKLHKTITKHTKLGHERLDVIKNR